MLNVNQVSCQLTLYLFQLLSIVHEIQTFDYKSSTDVRAIFLDRSKTFDKVWHQKLLFNQNFMEQKVISSDFWKTTLTVEKKE